MEHNIPEKFTLFGTRWTVSLVDEIYDDDGYKYGQCLYDLSEIRIALTASGRELSKERIISCFYHELTHAFFDSIGYHEASSDEVLIDNFSGLLHQYITDQFHSYE